MTERKRPAPIVLDAETCKATGMDAAVVQAKPRDFPCLHGTCTRRTRHPSWLCDRHRKKTLRGRK